MRCLLFLCNLQATTAITRRTASTHKPKARRISPVFVNFLSSSSSETNKQTTKQTLVTDHYRLTENQLQISPNVFFVWSTLSIQVLSQVCLYLATTGLYYVTICPIIWIDDWMILEKSSTIGAQNYNWCDEKDISQCYRHNPNRSQTYDVLHSNRTLSHWRLVGGTILICNKHSALVYCERFNVGNDDRLERVTSPFCLTVTSTL